MRPEPLRLRAVSALRLRPMTVLQLATCLSSTEGAIRNVVREIDVVRVGTTRTRGRPWIKWGLAA